MADEQRDELAEANAGWQAARAELEALRVRHEALRDEVRGFVKAHELQRHLGLEYDDARNTTAAKVSFLRAAIDA